MKPHQITHTPDEVYAMMDEIWTELFGQHFRGNWTRLQSNCRSKFRVMQNDALLYEGQSPTNAIAAYNKATLNA